MKASRCRASEAGSWKYKVSRVSNSCKLFVKSTHATTSPNRWEIDHTTNAKGWKLLSLISVASALALTMSFISAKIGINQS